MSGSAGPDRFSFFRLRQVLKQIPGTASPDLNTVFPFKANLIGTRPE